jgi:hypothetical protein
MREVSVRRRCCMNVQDIKDLAGSMAVVPVRVFGMSRFTSPVKVPAAALGALAVGALAVGALAVGALAIGSLGIGKLSARRVRVQSLEVEELRVGRLHIREPQEAKP